MRIVLQSLTLLLVVSSPGEATSLGLTVHVVPLSNSNGQMVRAHFSAIAPTPCPSLSGLCASAEDCVVHSTSLPFNGFKPDPGWCVRQWQKTVPSNYSGSITLGSNTEMFVSLKTPPVVRGNTGWLNNPAYVALPPPLRARVNCPHHFHLSTKDPDGDRVRCRFADADLGECVTCPRHSFIELDEEQCMFTFTGKAPAGQYYIYLMAEDHIPVPKWKQLNVALAAMSAVPVHLSLTVEESSSSCSDEPVAVGETPDEDTTLFVLPYEQITFRAQYMSREESVSEVAVVGPPNLFRAGFQTIDSLAMMTMAWVRSPNNLTRLLPICFAANTNSLQSEPRCIWLYQREMATLPAGTVLTCDEREMVLVLPVSSLNNINLNELQLNSPSCRVNYNTTHLLARISLDGCGTKIVQSGSELVYTNTLHSVKTLSVVRRKPILILPLACRIPSVQVKGPQYQMSIPTEEQTFGVLNVWIQVFQPGDGPLRNFTGNPRFRTDDVPNRVRRNVQEGAVGSRFNYLDLHVMSNCSIQRAEMISRCVECPTDDYTNCQPIIEQGCSTSSSAAEIFTSTNTSRVYRLNMTMVETQKSEMYIQCRVNLCIPTLPSASCPNLCGRSIQAKMLVENLFTRVYTVKSGPVSLVVMTPTPANAAETTTEASTATSLAADAATAAATDVATTSHAPKLASPLTAAGVVLTALSMLYQNIPLL